MRLIDASPLEEGGYKLERRRIYNGCEVIEGMSVSCVPTIDAELVRHGKWINKGSGEECSVCGEIQYGYDSYRNYCANCGARMDGEEWMT